MEFGLAEDEIAGAGRLTPRLVVADPRKFSRYVLSPANAQGKDRIFINRLGFRPQSDEDAKFLATLYVDQVRARLASGDYTESRRDEHGLRYIVTIDLFSVRLLSVWILRPTNVLHLVTPFTGFASDLEQEQSNG